MSDLLPLISIVGATLLMLAAEALWKKSEKPSFWIALAGIVASAIFAAQDVGRRGTAFDGMITVGGAGSYFSLIVLASAFFTVINSRSYSSRAGVQFGEWHLLVMFAATGMMLIAQAGDLMILFLGIELMSIALYVLAGFTRTRLLANEASLKYFLLGAFATGFLLYGIALLYGAAGTTNIGDIAAKFPALALSTIFWCGTGLLLTGLAFKAGAVPFHMWIPDVYQGSPTPVSGFMATGAKSAAFSALVLVFGTRIDPDGRLTLIIAILAAASMILGNVVAIAQSNLKRMLAYSSIAHAGYMLTGLAAGSAMGNTGIAFYATSYLFMNIGAFGIIAYLEEEPERNLTYDDYAGLGSRRPLLAALMSLFMFSLAGIPPLGGFIGKYYMFTAAVRADLTWLAIVGVLTSAVSVYYYLRLVVVMYFGESEGAISSARDIPSMAALLAAALATIILGAYPSPLLDVISSLF